MHTELKNSTALIYDNEGCKKLYTLFADCHDAIRSAAHCGNHVVGWSDELGYWLIYDPTLPSPEKVDHAEILCLSEKVLPIPISDYAHTIIAQLIESDPRWLTMYEKQFVPLLTPIN